MNNLVFVYGSLKQGFHNNRLLNDAQFVCKALTINNDYDMRSLGGFPGVTKLENGYHVTGEIYNVNDYTLENLDRLESNGTFYKREKIKAISLSQPAAKAYDVWIYVLLRDSYGSVNNVEQLVLENNEVALTWGK